MTRNALTGTAFPNTVTRNALTGTASPNIVTRNALTGTAFPNTVTRNALTGTAFPNTVTRNALTCTAFANTVTRNALTGTAFPNTVTRNALTSTAFEEIVTKCADRHSDSKHSDAKCARGAKGTVVLGSHFLSLCAEPDKAAVYSFHLATQLSGEKHACETHKSKRFNLYTCLPETVFQTFARPLKVEAFYFTRYTHALWHVTGLQVDSKDTPESSSRTLMSSL